MVCLYITIMVRRLSIPEVDISFQKQGTLKSDWFMVLLKSNWTNFECVLIFFCFLYLFVCFSLFLSVFLKQILQYLSGPPFVVQAGPQTCKSAECWDYQ